MRKERRERKNSGTGQPVKQEEERKERLADREKSWRNNKATVVPTKAKPDLPPPNATPLAFCRSAETIPTTVKQRNKHEKTKDGRLNP